MDVPLAGSALRRVTEEPDPLRGGPVALLAIQTNSLLLSTSPLGQVSLTRAVLQLRLRFDSRLIPPWGVHHTSSSGFRLLSGFGGVCFLLAGLHHITR